MGKGGSVTFPYCRSFLPCTNVHNVETVDQLKLWLPSEKGDALGGRVGPVEECFSFPSKFARSFAKTKSAALADVKELVLWVSVLLVSRLCNVPCIGETAATTKIKVCRGSLDGILWSVRICGVASVAMVLFLLFPSLHSWSRAEAIVPFESRFDKREWSSPGLLTSRYDSARSASPDGSASSPSFREVPSVRNAKNCAYSISNATADEFVCDSASVHIAMTLDGAYLRGSMAAIFSILQHASCPENIVFHFLVTDGDSCFQPLIRSTFPFLKFRIYHFDERLVRDRISSSVRQALEQPLNYARNYLADLLEPCVRRVIYLDSDLVVVDDIFKLWATRLGSNTVGAPEYCHANFTKYFSSSFWKDRDLSRIFDGRKPCYFNTGVMIIDLIKWRHLNFTKRIEQWMEVQKGRRIYELGSLPPFLLVFAGFVEPVEHRWNQHGLGGDNVRGSCRPLHAGPVSLLHWSGKGKPWARLDSGQPCPLDSLWAPYDLYVNSVY